MSGFVHANGSPCPANERTLCLFAAFLAESINHASIKVYLSAIRSLQIEMGHPDPLLSCLRLPRVVRGIRRSQGDSSSTRLPITADHLKIIRNSLDLRQHDHLMFWTASCLAFFGFLRSSEFTVPSLSAFSPAVHLTVADIAAEKFSQPTSLRVNIKASKTDPFRKGCFIFIGRGRNPICAVDAVLAFLHRRGDGQGPFVYTRERPTSHTRPTVYMAETYLGVGRRPRQFL